MLMKVLNVTVDGAITIINTQTNVECTVDNTDDRFTTPVLQKVDDLIAELEASNFQSIHIEHNSLGSFVHKVGINNFDAEANPTDYDLFSTFDDWTPAFEDEEIT